MKNDGGPAGPGKVSVPGELILPHHGGMPLRDWYAGQALALTQWRLDKPKTSEEMYAEKIATAVYKIADAMLSERAKVEQ